MSAPSFFDLQARARRRSLLLLTGSFLILWIAFNIVTFVMYLDNSNCLTTDTGTERCSVQWNPNWIWLATTAAITGIYVLIASLASARAALALSGAHEATGSQYTQLRNIVEEMAIASGTPVPKVYVVDDPSPNAFATGRSPQRAAVTVTTGLLQQLSRRELSGVVAHELAHIRNRDIAVTTIAVLTAGTIAAIADIAMRFAWYATHLTSRGRGSRNGGAAVGLAIFVVAIVLYAFALPAALLLRAALSRQRETLADTSAVQYTRDPTGLRSALEKLEADTSSPTRVSVATAHLWIDEPRPMGPPQRRILSGIFDTHPPISTRIATLRRIEGIDPDGRGPNDPWPPPVV